MKKLKNYPSGIKTKVVPEAFLERESIQVLAKRYGLQNDYDLEEEKRTKKDEFESIKKAKQHSAWQVGICN